MQERKGRVAEGAMGFIDCEVVISGLTTWPQESGSLGSGTLERSCHWIFSPSHPVEGPRLIEVPLGGYQSGWGEIAYTCKWSTAVLY